MIYQVVLETKYPEYIERYILSEHDSLIAAQGVINWFEQIPPGTVTPTGRLERFAIQTAVSVWAEPVFRLV
jgi:hypothetical protein